MCFSMERAQCFLQTQARSATLSALQCGDRSHTTRPPRRHMRLPPHPSTLCSPQLCGVAFVCDLGVLVKRPLRLLRLELHHVQNHTIRRLQGKGKATCQRPHSLLAGLLAAWGAQPLPRPRPHARTRLVVPVTVRVSDSSRGTRRFCTETAAGSCSSLKARFSRISASSSASLSSARP